MFHKSEIRSTVSIRPHVLKTAKTWRLPYASFGRIIEEYYIALDTPFSLMCLTLYRAGQYNDLVNVELDPHHYNDADRFSRDLAAQSFLRKAEFLKTGIDTKQVALDSFAQNEQSCLNTNTRFANLAFDPQFSGLNVSLLSRFERKIAWFLGVKNTDSQSCEASGLDIGEFFDSGSWGPGVSLLVKGSDTSASRKFEIENELTQQLHRFLLPAARLAYAPWLGARDDFRVVQGSSVITVPKNAKTDRTIAVEPGLNLFFQKAAGRILRRKLRNRGYDLNTDRRSQQAAFWGSRFGALATVDFSAASDTISTELLRQVLPSKWFALLDILRSPRYTFDGAVYHDFNKFSSMGNGFTFELESLLFLSAALAVCEELGSDTSNVTVFGDDIIIPGECVNAYASFCAFLGFKVNTKKSYSTSYYRESCGAYYFKGVNVKPLFLKKELRSLLDTYEIHNKLFERARNFEPRLEPLVRYIKRVIPKDLQIWGPPGYGRTVLYTSRTGDCQLRKHPRFEGFYFSSWLEVPQKLANESYGHLLAALARTSSDINYLDVSSLLPLGNRTTLRGVTRLGFTAKAYVARLW